MDIMKGKSLYCYTKDKTIFSKMDIKKILYANGLDYLHKNNIMHRDIKPENIMFKDKNSFENPCIVDFGLSTKIDEENLLLVKCGTPGYLAPEIANLRDRNERYNEKCDLFSLGAIAYKLFSGKNLFVGNSNTDILEKNLNCI